MAVFVALCEKKITFLKDLTSFPETLTKKIGCCRCFVVLLQKFSNMNNMVVKELLQQPLSGIHSSNAQEKFAKIAQNLFNNFCIKCGEKRFYFAEIEFYYYDRRQYSDNTELYKWQKVTYARTMKSAGDFLYHLSGVDICFDSIYDKDGAIFGGILIRSIKDDKGNLISGPLTCKDVILNASVGEMPILEKYAPKKPIVPEPCKRLLGKNDMENKIDGDLNLCFYEKNLNWEKTTKREVYNKETGGVETKIKDYSIRFCK